MVVFTRRTFVLIPQTFFELYHALLLYASKIQNLFLIIFYLKSIILNFKQKKVLKNLSSAPLLETDYSTLSSILQVLFFYIFQFSNQYPYQKLIIVMQYCYFTFCFWYDRMCSVKKITNQHSNLSVKKRFLLIVIRMFLIQISSTS